MMKEVTVAVFRQPRPRPPTSVVSFTINLLYRIRALANDDGTREIRGVGRFGSWISIGGGR